MSYDPNNAEQHASLEAALRRDVPAEQPLSDELHARIVTSIREQSNAATKVPSIRRFAAVAAVAACVILTAGVAFMMTRNPERPATPVAHSDKPAAKILAKAPVMVDDSLAAVEEFATDSVVREMRDLAKDASDIGSAMFVSLPIKVPWRGD